MFDVPVVLIVYKRLEKTKEVFARIKEISPSFLYIISDGPKNPEDEIKVREVREFIDQNIDWPCKVSKRYLEKNLGLRYGIPAGIDWVFEQEEQAIILEDDIVPDKVFFSFCKEMLEKYRHNENVMMVSGFNIYEDNQFFKEYDYTFGFFSCIWGWATWKRAWERYETNISSWPKMRRSGWLKSELNKNGYNHYKITFDDLRYHWYNSWGFQWQYALFKYDGVGIIPRYNMITNIGMNDIDGEHYGDEQEKADIISSRNHHIYDNLIFNGPLEISRNIEYDNNFQNKFYPKTSMIKMAKYSLRAAIHSFCMKMIRKMERDNYYFEKILPEKYKLSYEEQNRNNGDRYKQISAEELRKTACNYLIYKSTRINLFR